MWRKPPSYQWDKIKGTNQVFVGRVAKWDDSQVAIYPQVIKHGNWKYSIYSWFSQRSASIEFGDFQLPCLITGGYPEKMFTFKNKNKKNSTFNWVTKGASNQWPFCGTSTGGTVPYKAIWMGGYGGISLHRPYIYIYICIYIYIYGPYLEFRFHKWPHDPSTYGLVMACDLALEVPIVGRVANGDHWIVIITWELLTSNLHIFTRVRLAPPREAII